MISKPWFLFRIFRAPAAILPRRVMVRTEDEDFEKTKKKTNRRERGSKRMRFRGCKSVSVSL